MLSNAISEKSVLSAIYNGGVDAYIEVSDILKPKTFSIPANEVLYVVLQHAFEEKKVENPDVATIYSSAQDLGLLNVVQKYESHISQIISFPSTKENVRKFAQQIKKLEIARQTKVRAQQIMDELDEVTGNEKIGEIIGIAEKKIFDLSSEFSSTDDEPKTLGCTSEAYLKQKEENPVEQPGISTGFPVWDKSIGGGLRPGSISVVGARAKGFKSGFALTVGLHVARKVKLPVLYLDTELQDFEQIPRAIASMSNIFISDIETGKFAKDPVKKQRAYEAAKGISDNFYHKNIAGMGFDEQMSAMRRWLFKSVGVGLNGKANPCVIIYDYLKLMDTNGLNELKEHQLVGFRLTEMHNFSVRYNIPILTFVQLNRDGLNREDTGVISQSDRILWFCSNFSIFKRKSQEEIDMETEQGIVNAGNFKLKPLACRHGAGIEENEYINFQVNAPYFQIREGKLSSECLHSPGSDILDDISGVCKIDF